MRLLRSLLFAIVLPRSISTIQPMSGSVGVVNPTEADPNNYKSSDSAASTDLIDLLSPSNTTALASPNSTSSNFTTSIESAERSISNTTTSSLNSTDSNTANTAIPTTSHISTNSTRNSKPAISFGNLIFKTLMLRSNHTEKQAHILTTFLKSNTSHDSDDRAISNNTISFLNSSASDTATNTSMLTIPNISTNFSINSSHTNPFHSFGLATSIAEVLGHIKNLILNPDEDQAENTSGLVFNCTRGAICEIPLSNIIASSPPIVSNVTVLTESSGLDLVQTEDRKRLIGLALTHGVLPYVLRYSGDGDNTIEVPFEVNISEKVFPNHIFYLKFDEPNLQCQDQPAPCVEFLQSLAKAFNGPSSSLTFEKIRKYENGTQLATFHNNTLSLVECEKKELEKMSKKIMQREGFFKEEFLQKMGPEFVFVGVSVKFARSCQNFTINWEAESPSTNSYSTIVICAVVLIIVVCVGAGVGALKMQSKKIEIILEKGNNQDDIELAPLQQEMENVAFDEDAEDEVQELEKINV